MAVSSSRAVLLCCALLVFALVNISELKARTSTEVLPLPPSIDMSTSSARQRPATTTETVANQQSSSQDDNAEKGSTEKVMRSGSLEISSLDSLLHTFPVQMGVTAALPIICDVLTVNNWRRDAPFAPPLSDWSSSLSPQNYIAKAAAVLCNYDAAKSAQQQGQEQEEAGRCTLAMTHLAIALGRTRLYVTILANTGGFPRYLASRPALEKFLFSVSPAFYVSHATATEMVLERRSKLFVFGVTGGKNGPSRAAFAEHTWGRRTPIVWFADNHDARLNPIVDLHPQYVRDPDKLFTFKMSRIWQHVFKNFHNRQQGDDIIGGGGYRYDWYVRLWDDNYFLEENVYNSLGRLLPTRSLGARLFGEKSSSGEKDDAAFSFPKQGGRNNGSAFGTKVMAGKIGWRYLSNTAIFPFAGGGAGWYLSHDGMASIGPTIDDAEKWFVEFRARKDIFLPHDIHDEDVFLTAWFHLKGMQFINIPGVEHVSPGRGWRQRCMSENQLHALRWNASSSTSQGIFFDYPAREPQFRIEENWYAFTRPIIWHYMSPSRLLWLERVLYPDRANELASSNVAGGVPQTAADKRRKSRQCYPGTPMTKNGTLLPVPPRGLSVFETPLRDPV